MSELIDISIVIVTYKSKEYISRCIQSIQESAFGFTIEIIVVDNASGDGIVNLLQTEFPEVILIENKNNEGFAQGVNIGAGIASGRYILILNPDTELFPNTLKFLINFMENYTKDCIVGPRTVNEFGECIPSCRSLPHIGNLIKYPISFLLRGKRLKKPRRYLMDLWEQNETLDIRKYNGYLTGACMLTKLDFFKKMGMFDNQYFLCAEDADFGLRITQSGFPSFLIAEASIIHYGGRSVSKNIQSRVYTIDAYLRYINKNLSFFHGLIYKSCYFLIILYWILKASLRKKWNEVYILLSTLKYFRF